MLCKRTHHTGLPELVREKIYRVDLFMLISDLCGPCPGSLSRSTHGLPLHTHTHPSGLKTCVKTRAHRLPSSLCVSSPKLKRSWCAEPGMRPKIISSVFKICLFSLAPRTPPPTQSTSRIHTSHAHRKACWHHWSRGPGLGNRSCFSTLGNYMQLRIHLFTQNRCLSPTHPEGGKKICS